MRTNEERIAEIHRRMESLKRRRRRRRIIYAVISVTVLLCGVWLAAACLRKAEN